MPRGGQQTPEVPDRVEPLGLRIVGFIHGLDHEVLRVPWQGDAPASPGPVPRPLARIVNDARLLPGPTAIRRDVHSDDASSAPAERVALDFGLAVSCRPDGGDGA